SPYPMLMTFDSPDSNVTCTRRERSNTPLQALTVLNDTVFVECAQALGKRLADAGGDPRGRVALGVGLCLGREPTPAEHDRFVRLFDELYELAKANPAAAAKLLGSYRPAKVDATEGAAWVALGRTLLNLDEFITRE